MKKKIRKLKKNIQIIWILIKKYVYLHQRNKEKRNVSMKGFSNLFQLYI